MNYTGSTLAYIGDAVLSLQVRKYLVDKNIQRPKRLLEESIHFVSAKAQAAFIVYLLEEGLLNPVEIEVYKRGRNVKSTSIAKNADVVTYRMATGLEALWGYLYLNDEHNRLNDLWNEFKKVVEHEIIEIPS